MTFHILLERSRRRLQLYFRRQLDQRSTHKVMGPQNHRQNDIWVLIPWPSTKYIIRGKVVSSDALPSSLIDSNVSLKWKQRKSKKLGHVIWLAILWGRRVCYSSGMGIKKSDKHQLLTRTCTNQTTSWLMCNYSTLVHGRNTGEHKLTRFTTTQTLGRPPPSPL